MVGRLKQPDETFLTYGAKLKGSIPATRRTRHHKECTLDEVVGQIKEWLRRAMERCAPKEKRCGMQDQ
ncbi:hypothetical protein HPB52_022860 [Rhipicephalus sanguineus]|uniref:Uncharacterized protein n=1 Tax=Rhipicephalus sanguineus TaxID=34632 RepID=A0A9D4TBX7_RHISA|nr:hypothetical protein HPB52_022860 [Rhipicephalus sanguineus]